MGIQEEPPQIPSSSLSSKAVNFVSNIATGLLNPISDNPSKTHHHSDSKNPHNSEKISKKEQKGTDSNSEDDSESIDGPDTSSFTAFLFSLLSSKEPRTHSNTVNEYGFQEDIQEESPVPYLSESGRKKTSISRGKHLEKAMYLSLPEFSDASLLLSEKTRFTLHASLPAPAQGRKWVLLYSTWRHGISLSTLYRRSMLWPGTSLLVAGDRKGAVFGGLVEAPLRPSTKKRYQGSNSSFVFSNVSGHPVVFRPTGANRYYTLCTTEYLALGGGGHFALYLDGDLLSGSSSTSETYGNSCLANAEDFEVKEVELWGFVYASKYEEVISLLRTEAPGICRLLN